MAGDEVAVVVEVDAATSAPRSQQRQNTLLHRRFYEAGTIVLQYFNDTSSVVLQWNTEELLKNCRTGSVGEELELGVGSLELGVVFF